MNRWSEWARRLRSRHGRVEARRSAAAMVLHRPLWAQGSLMVSAATRIHLSVHAPMGIVLRPVAAPVAMLHAQPAQAAPVFVAQTHRQASAAHPPPLVPRIESSPIPRNIFPAKFVHAHTAATVRTSTVERMWLPLRELATAWLRKPPASMAAEALPLRLRQRAVRIERPGADLPKMVAPVRRDAGGEPANAQLRNVQSTAPWTPVLPSQQPAPAINVDALTSQVMQQIDRRLVAWRERMGRA